MIKIKKGKSRSQSSLMSTRSGKSEMGLKEDIYVPPLDTLTVSVLNLRVSDVQYSNYRISVSFFDQLLLTAVIKPISLRSLVEDDKPLAQGIMNYDPSDYERMCLFADTPLVVHVQPTKSSPDSNSFVANETSTNSADHASLLHFGSEIYCCNTDILPLFIDTNKLLLRKRLQTMRKPSALRARSWLNLPLISIELSVDRNQENGSHHSVLSMANDMKLSLLGVFNLNVAYDRSLLYTAASKMPLSNEMNSATVVFNQGYKQHKRSNILNSYPCWETLRSSDTVFSKSDDKMVVEMNTISNKENIDLQHYMKSDKLSRRHTAIWNSFHRTVMLPETEKWFTNQIRDYQWPLEVHLYGDRAGYSFMGMMNFFDLLHPGESVIRQVVPLQWVNAEDMLDKCGCNALLTACERTPSFVATAARKPGKFAEDSLLSADLGPKPTGSDGASAFAIIEVRLRKPLKKTCIPPHVTEQELSKMLSLMEKSGPSQRECTGRAQNDQDWLTTVRNAASAIRRVPYYGVTELCLFNRQLSESRTRVELTTSFWQEAAVFVNNNFVPGEFLQSDKTFEEMLIMAHACLVRSASSAIVDESNDASNHLLRAARQARQMQDIQHAKQLYLQLVSEDEMDGNRWRELAVCLLDLDRPSAVVCIDEAILLDSRHPLTLLTKGSLVFEDDPDVAEPYFYALILLYPYWSTVWVIANAYYLHREMFDMADEIMNHVTSLKEEGLNQDAQFPRVWEKELGDWWDSALILPGMSVYYDAADLLLRIRSIPLAEVCLSRALCESGESAAYYHFAALCSRLRGDVANALCHLRQGLEKYGEISYLRILEAECLHQTGDCSGAMVVFKKAGCCISPFNILLSLGSYDSLRARSLLTDLLRRHPCAYGWLAMADQWLSRAELGEGGDGAMTAEQSSALTNASASACAALRLDRRSRRAWALLAKLQGPSTRREYCWKMAAACYCDGTAKKTPSDLSFCWKVGRKLDQCRCQYSMTI